MAYLEKENEDKSIEDMEQFFNQYESEISNEEVIAEIDKNTYKLKKVEPKFYSITVNPSAYELRHLQNHSMDLKIYTREIIKDYAASFYRDTPVSVDQIKYYAKIEYERTYKGTDKAIQENAPFHGKIMRLKNEIQQIKSGELVGNINQKMKEIKQLEKNAPHQINGQMILQGMAKEGSQSHIHIIVSRMDNTNRLSLSPGSKYKASEVVFNGVKTKRGFDRDKFFTASEKTFDRVFLYNRNYVETYNARKAFQKNPQKYFASIMGLPTNERAIAFKLMSKTGVNTSLLNIPTNQVQLALKVIKKFKRSVDIALKSGSIGI